LISASDVDNMLSRGHLFGLAQKLTLIVSLSLLTVGAQGRLAYAYAPDVAYSPRTLGLNVPGLRYLSACFRDGVVGAAGNCPPGLEFQFRSRVAPKRLPKEQLAQAAVTLKAKITTTDGAHPPALRKLKVNFDRDIAIYAKGLPVCHPFRRYRSAADLKARCRSAIIGHGAAEIEIASPGEASTKAPARLTVYNGGIRSGVTILYVAAFTTASTRNPTVTIVKVSKIHRGHTGMRAVVKIPRIANGNASLLNFEVRLARRFTYRGQQKSYVLASCSDRHIINEVSAAFRNEISAAGVPLKSLIKGLVIQPCSPTN